MDNIDEQDLLTITSLSLGDIKLKLFGTVSDPGYNPAGLFLHALH